MKRSKKTDVLLLKFKLKYRAIFFNKFFKTICDKHFDSKMGFAAFTIGLLQNQIGEKKAQKHIQININDWMKVLSDIYDNHDVVEAFNKLSLNPIIPFEDIENYFECFNVSIEKIVHYVKSEQLDLKINDAQLKYILKSTFGYIMYNCLDCKIPYDLKNILSDYEYDQKFIMITNNTKLYAKCKSAILSNCSAKVSDLLSLLLGISRDLNLDK